MTYGPIWSLEEKNASLFHSDPSLYYQYLETLRSRTRLEPERELMLAVLEDAIVCFQQYAFARDGRGRRLFLDAQRWIVEKDCNWPFSFENICFHLGMDPSYIRHGLLRWTERVLSELPKATHRLAHEKITMSGDRKVIKAA